MFRYESPPDPYGIGASGGPVETLAHAFRHGERLGYPLLVKATAGGGGHGIRRVNSPEELEHAFESARAEAAKAFGNPTVFMEQLVQGARHVEVQIIADRYGNTWAAGVRDCTIQRRHQKVLEEAPSPALSPEQDEYLRKAAVRLSQVAGYYNAGTVEFLYQPETQSFAFMEMNTRLQVEHPVTECTTRLDLVKLQIHIARGGRLEGEAPRTTGHAIEMRLNAEDPDNAFAPAPGSIEQFRVVTGPGVRIDTGVTEGDAVPPEFDSMIAKIIAHGRDRGEALSRLNRALRESVVVVRGGASNKAFLLELLNRPEVQSGTYDIGWLDRLTIKGEHLSRQYADVAMVQAAIEVYNAEFAAEREQFYASAVRGRPRVRCESGRVVELRYRGNAYSLKVSRLGTRQYRVAVAGSSLDAEIDRLGRFEYWLTGFGRRFHIVSVVQGLSYRIEVDGVAHHIDRDDGGIIHAPAPAAVVSVAVQPGDTVKAGDRLVVLEAMKMETQVVAPFAGKVRRVMTLPNVQVGTGDPLIQIEPDTEESGTGESGTGSGAAQRVVFGASFAPDFIPGIKNGLEEFRQFMLGFDVDLKDSARLVTESGPGAGHEGDQILSIFVDICSLFHRQPEFDDSIGGESPTAEAHLFSYLRKLETRGQELPPAFLEALKRTLTHYGVHSLDPSPELEETLLWIYKSHQRVQQQVGPVLALLERRLDSAELTKSQQPESLRNLLDRMISITRGVFPSISNLAREVSYRCFDQPLIEHSRRAIYREMERHLSDLAVNPESSDRPEKLRAMIECPQPLVSLFSGRFANATPELRQVMLEVLTRRYYRIRALHDLRSFSCHDQCCISARYEHEGRHIHVFTTYGAYSQVTSIGRALSSRLERVPATHDVAIDFYLWRSDSLAEADLTERELRSMLNETSFPRNVRRIVVAIAGPGSGPGMGGMQHFTFRPSESGFEEEKLYRGLHPMMGKRLHLWRLGNFKIERVPSVEDVYLFHAVAHENAKDERLFAFAEVRDLTPVRDESGRVVQLPHLERMLTEALASIRQFQSRRKPQERLHWNRVLLYVWPPLALTPQEFETIVHKLALTTEGLGLEQVAVRARIPNPETGELRDMVVRISSPGGTGLLVTFRPATKRTLIQPLTEYEQKVVRMRQRGTTYPYEIIKMLTPGVYEMNRDTGVEFPPGEFIEHDLDENNCLVPVDRAYGKNKANIIAGVIRNFTPKYPEGMTRVLLAGDPSKELGAIAEPECRRIIAALDLAERMGVPLEWFPVSAGAKISMESGVENMDWIARVLRRLIEFTQMGGEVNLVINGINVGAQPYWNAEATMLMHTRGILVMTPAAAMVLTGKHALDYSGSVSAEDNQGIGGYDRVMGPNGQAQYWARDAGEACKILLRHYDHTYVAPGERFPRRAVTTDPIDRDVRLYPHGNHHAEAFATIGEIFSDETNAGRKRSFDIRKVMMATVDQDHAPLERWAGMRAAETSVVWDAHLGGIPVCLIGIESHPVPRLGFVPADGPDAWTAGTLFPLSSKKVARAINAASNNRPLVVLANLSGFDGSPESLRKLQLEYGAEIGRAVVNFKGPMVFCVVSRYHGGAYVVFSRALNDDLRVVALEGTYASVIGGAPAAAVVFAGEVQARAKTDPRLQPLNEAIAQATGVEKSRLMAQLNELFKVIHSEKLGEVADEFDSIHSVDRALRVGALDEIIPPASLRPHLIHEVERAVEAYCGSREVAAVAGS